MWLYTKIGMFSVVKERGTDRIAIRARRRSHLLELKESIPHKLRRLIEVIGPHETRDYKWRIAVPRWAWEEIALYLARGVNYENFKDTCEGDRDYHDKMLTPTWALARRYQDGQ